MTLEQVLPHYLETVRPGPSVRAAIGDSWPKFVRYCGALGLVELEEVRACHLQDYHQHLLWEPNRQGHFYKPNSVDQFLRRVRQILRWCCKEGLLDKDPSHGFLLPRPVQPVAELLSWDELQALLAAPDRSQGTGLRDAALFALVTETELGLTGCLELRLGHESHLVLEKPTAELLAAYLEKGRPRLALYPEETALFLGKGGRPLGRQSAFVRIQAAARRAGLSMAVGGRTLRRSYCAHLDRQAQSRLSL